MCEIIFEKVDEKINETQKILDIFPLDFQEMVKYLIKKILIKDTIEKNYLHNEVNPEFYFEYFLQYIKETRIYKKFTIKNRTLNIIIKFFKSNMNVNQFHIYLKEFFTNLKDDIICRQYFYDEQVVYEILNFDYYFFPVRFVCKDENINERFKNYLMINNLELEKGMIKFCPEYNLRKKLFDENLVKEILNIEIENNFYPKKHFLNILKKHDNIIPEFNVNRCKYMYHDIFYDHVYGNNFIYWILEYKFGKLENEYQIFIEGVYIDVFVYIIRKINKKNNFTTILSSFSSRFFYEIIPKKMAREIKNI